MTAWIYLLLAGVTEIFFTVFLKLSKGFTQVIPTIAFFVSSFVSLYFMSKANNTLPLSIVYSVWCGIGIVGTALTEVLIFKQPLNLTQIFCVLTILISIIVLKFAS